MKKLTKIFLALCALSFSFSALASTNNLKIAVVDMRVILSKSPQAIAVGEKLKNEFKAREEQLVALDKSLKDKTEKLQRNSAIMSESEKSRMERDIHNTQRELQRVQNDFREDATARQQEETKKLIDNVSKAVNEIATSDHYDLVLHKEAASFAASQIDITDKVIKLLTTKSA